MCQGAQPFSIAKIQVLAQNTQSEFLTCSHYEGNEPRHGDSRNGIGCEAIFEGKRADSQAGIYCDLRMRVMFDRAKMEPRRSNWCGSTLR